MTCRRCQGLMVGESLVDEVRSMAFDMWRCLSCGNLTDAQSEYNRVHPAKVDAGGKKTRDHRASFPIPQSLQLTKEARHEIYTKRRAEQRAS